MPRGRPIKSVPNDMADSVVAWIAEGKTLREWCRQEGNPSFGTIYAWINKDVAFAKRIAHARESGEDAIFEECMEIMDDGRNDWMMSKVGPQVNPENVHRSKLRVWGRLELLKRWNPKKYGDRQAIEHSGDMTLSLADTISKARKRIAK